MTVDYLRQLPPGPVPALARSKNESYVAIRDYYGVDELGHPFDFKAGVSVVHGSWSTLSKQPDLMRYLAPTGSSTGLCARVRPGRDRSS